MLRMISDMTVKFIHVYRFVFFILIDANMVRNKRSSYFLNNLLFPIFTFIIDISHANSNVIHLLTC